MKELQEQIIRTLESDVKNIDDLVSVTQWAYRRALKLQEEYTQQCEESEPELRYPE